LVVTGAAGSYRRNARNVAQAGHAVNRETLGLENLFPVCDGLPLSDPLIVCRQAVPSIVERKGRPCHLWRQSRSPAGEIYGASEAALGR